MKTLVTTALAAATLFTSGSFAKSATIEVSHECKKEPCEYTIFISGDIVKGDADRFLNLVKQNKLQRDTLVVLDSLGGHMLDAYTIGMEIHERGFLTYVGQEKYCVSACSDIWLAGKVRYISTEGRVGFHAASLEKKGKRVRVKQADEITKTYYRRLGLPETAIRYLLAADPNDLTWLKADKADELGIIATTIKPEEKQKDAKTEKHSDAVDVFPMGKPNALLPPQSIPPAAHFVF